MNKPQQPKKPFDPRTYQKSFRREAYGDYGDFPWIVFIILGLTLLPGYWTFFVYWITHL